MGCWGITSFESDAGLDSVNYIRSILPGDGKLELGKVIDPLQKDDVWIPDVQDAESHTSPMALAEIVARFLEHDIGDLDYDADWAAKDKKFADITSFSASRESILWLREYLSDTLKYARENAEFKAGCGTNWNGWFKEKDWIGWQEHMENLVNQLDTLLSCPKERLELVSLQKQGQGLQIERNNDTHTNKSKRVSGMKIYELKEHMERFDGQAELDKELMGSCIKGLTIYASQFTRQHGTEASAGKIQEIRRLIAEICEYWELDDFSRQKQKNNIWTRLTNTCEIHPAPCICSRH